MKKDEKNIYTCIYQGPKRTRQADNRHMIQKEIKWKEILEFYNQIYRC